MRKKQKEIQWFFNFINIKKIEGLSEKERAEIANTIFKYTRYQRLDEKQKSQTPGAHFMELLPNSISPERLISFQKRIADFFKFMTNRIEHMHQIPSKGWTMAEDTDFFPNLSADRIKISYTQVVNGLKYKSKITNGGATEYRLIPESLDDAFIDTSYDSSRMQEDFFLYSFINLINGLPIKAFNKCAECENWFVNLMKKEKKYCANRCAARKIQREKRVFLKTKIAAGDSEAIRKNEIELQKARVRASRAYDKRVKKRNPRAKIHKNPRKPHWQGKDPSV